ncbi:GGDEF domain-containing protein [Photobacterium sp. SDRW27]|uniref:GGDEF domain-containing protein n=1 Tax=Photobacterium obscurum TaxID=2829490 RepID=UPI002244E7E8|nr:GGDEF domain-containing protein [Photobacterium obscurum]MCW8329314.1 GGDEF domain-containing protein [Photobacterium obscurum]
MTTVIKSAQLESTNFAYIELSKQTLKNQLNLLFPVSGGVCLIIAFTYFVSDISPGFTLSALFGAVLSYLLSVINRYNVNPHLLIWVFIGFITLNCGYGFYADSTHLVSNTIALTIPLLCFFSLRHEHAWWYSLIFGLIYITMNAGKLSDKHLQITEALQNISAYSMVLIMAYLLAQHRNEAIERVKKTATTDFLTNLYNRHGLEAVYRNEASRCQRYMRDISMLLIDIDNLKTINDRYGLEAGDQILMMLAKCLQQKVRKNDYIARLDSQEFCLLLPDTDIKQAEELATCLKDEVASWALELNSGHRVTITVSIGLTPVEYQQFSHDYVKADSALQRAKNWGRNQVAVSH